MRKIIVILFLLLAGSRVEAWASGFNLKSIGNVSTDGLQISHWWYTGWQPTLRGEASGGADVTITIDNTPMVASADSAGEWVYTPAGALSGGDHTVKLESGGSTINFTLTLGAENVDWNAVGSTGQAIPAAGVTWPTWILIILAGIMLLGGSVLRLRS